MTAPTPNAWTLYRTMFGHGDEVFIVTEDDCFDWGRIGCSDDHGVTLTRAGMRSRFYSWDAVGFMAHDGFPIKQIMGSNPLPLTEGCSVLETVRDSFDRGSWSTHVVWGDPWLIGPVQTRLLNRGRTHPNDWMFEEVVICEAADGLRGLLYDVANVLEVVP